MGKTLDVHKYIEKSESEEEAIARICLLSTPNPTIAKKGEAYKYAKEYFDNPIIKPYARKIVDTYKKGSVGTPIFKILNKLCKKNVVLLPKNLKNDKKNKLLDSDHATVVMPSNFSHSKVMEYLVAWKLISEAELEKLYKKGKKSAKLSTQQKAFAIIEREVRNSWNEWKNTNKNHKNKQTWFTEKDVINGICNAFNNACKSENVNDGTDIQEILTENTFFKKLSEKYKNKNYKLTIDDTDNNYTLKIEENK